MTYFERAERRVYKMEVRLTRFRLRYYIRGRAKRGCWKRHLKMVDYLMSLLATLKHLKSKSKPKHNHNRYTNNVEVGFGFKL